MQIVLDEEYAKSLRKAIFDFYRNKAVDEENKRASEGLWHVSDLVFPKATYNKVVFGEEVTDEMIGLWMTGIAFHREMQRVLGEQYAEVEVKLGNMVAHIDHFDLVLLELKTSRKWSLPDTPEPHYVRQLGMYAAMTGKNEVKLAVLYPTLGRTWDGKTPSQVVMRAWKMVFTDADLEKIRYSMTITTQMITHAIATKNPDLLPPCPKWKCPDNGGSWSDEEEARHPFFWTDIQGYERPRKPKVYKGRKFGTRSKQGVRRDGIPYSSQRRVTRTVR